MHRVECTFRLALLAVMVAGSLLAGCQGTGARPAMKNPFKFAGPGRTSKDLQPDELLDPLGARNPDRVTMHDLAPGQIGTTLRTLGKGKPDEAAAQQHFDQGQIYYQEASSLRETNAEDPRAGDLMDQAAREFRLAAHRWPDSALEQDALFFLGESYYFANRYVQANRAYESLIAQYSGSHYFDRAEERRFSIARYWLGRARDDKGLKAWKPGDPARPAMGMAGEGRRILHRIRLDDPTGKLADDATMQLAAAFMEAHMFQDAADAFEDVRQSYPGSQHNFNAHLFELKCRMNCYYGKSYEAEPLVKADELLRQIVTRFPVESAEHDDYLGREASRVRNLLAEREYTMGQYYENRGENRAASLMYQEVARNFGDTGYADQVDDRLAEVGEGPPLPPQQAQWLVDLFPKTERARPMIASGDKESLLR